MKNQPAPGQLIAVLLIRRLLMELGEEATVGTFYSSQTMGKRGVVVQRMGGRLRNPVTDEVFIVIQVYGAREADAEALATKLYVALSQPGWAGRRIDGRLIRGWNQASAPAKFSDPDNPKVSRFQFSGELLVSVLQS